MKKPLLIAIMAIALIGGIVATHAVTNWGQSISWNITANTNFTVYDSLVGGAEIPDATLLNLTTPTNPTIINYYIQNTGNVQIRVTGTITFTVGTATATWNPPSGYIDIPVGTTRTQLTLTLSNFSVGTGQATVNFASTQTP